MMIMARTRYVLAVCLVVPGLFAASDAGAFSQRGPDAHVVRQPRGDVLVVVSPSAPYSAPHAGWTYKPLKAGARLQPIFYTSRYVVIAPRGVPPARGRQRWIRYGDDLLLVDTRGGRVARVVSGGYRLAYPRGTG